MLILTRVNKNKADSETYYSLSEVLDMLWQLQHYAADGCKQANANEPFGDDGERKMSAVGYAYDRMADYIRCMSRSLHS